VIFSEGQVVSHVRITSGNQILAVGNIATDLVVMDDFIYGEPRRVPEPSTVLLLALGLSVTLRARLRRSIV